jgi:plasmid stability protein
MHVDPTYVTSVRLPEKNAMMLKAYAARHGWSVCRAVKEAVTVAVAIDEATTGKAKPAA